MSVSGEIIDLGTGDWSQKRGEEYFRSVKLSEFFRVQGISIADANTAIDIIKLTEEISYAPGQATMLRRNTNNFTTFDSRLYKRFSWNENWKYLAKKEEGYWLVTRWYAGPPASINMPPRWEIVLDKKGQLTEIRCKHK